MATPVLTILQGCYTGLTNTVSDATRALTILQGCYTGLTNTVSDATQVLTLLQGCYTGHLLGYARISGITVFKIFIWGVTVGYTIGNLVLRRRESRAVKRDFRTYILRYTSPNEKI